MVEVPTISVAYDLDTGLHEIIAMSYGRASPAGPRLFRAPPHPEIRWSHDTPEAAEADAQKLRAYLDSLTQRKGPSKAALRKLGAD